MTTITAAERLLGSAPSSAFASLTPSEPEAPTATIQGMGPLSDRGAKTLGSAIGVLPSNHRREHKELSAADAQAPYQRWTLHRPFQPIGKAKTAKDVACANCVSLLWPRKRFPHFFRQQGLVDKTWKALLKLLVDAMRAD